MLVSDSRWESGSKGGRKQWQRDLFSCIFNEVPPTQTQKTPQQFACLFSYIHGLFFHTTQFIQCPGHSHWDVFHDGITLPFCLILLAFSGPSLLHADSQHYLNSSQQHGPLKWPMIRLTRAWTLSPFILMKVFLHVKMCYKITEGIVKCTALSGKLFSQGTVLLELYKLLLLLQRAFRNLSSYLEADILDLFWNNLFSPQQIFAISVFKPWWYLFVCFGMPKTFYARVVRNTSELQKSCPLWLRNDGMAH